MDYLLYTRSVEGIVLLLVNKSMTANWMICLIYLISPVDYLYNIKPGTNEVPLFHMK